MTRLTRKDVQSITEYLDGPYLRLTKANNHADIKITFSFQRYVVCIYHICIDMTTNMHFHHDHQSQAVV